MRKEEEDKLKDAITRNDAALAKAREILEQYPADDVVVVCLPEKPAGNPEPPKLNGHARASGFRRLLAWFLPVKVKVG